MEKKKMIEVAVVAPIEKTFYYTVPVEYSSRALLGMKVTVPFGKRAVTGYIIGFPDAQGVSSGRGTIKILDIKDIPDSEPAFTPAMLDLYKWIADYYISPLGDVIKTALPVSKGKVKKERVAIILEPAVQEAPMTPKEEKVLSFIRKRGRASMRDINAEFGSPYEIIKRLSTKGLISVVEEEVSRIAYKQGSVTGSVGATGRSPLLTEPQLNAFSEIK